MALGFLSVSDLALVLPFVIERTSRILVDFTEEGLFSISTVDIYVFGVTNLVLLCLSDISLAILFTTETERL